MDELFAIGEFVMFLLLVYGAGLSAIYWQLGDPTNIEKNRDDREPLRGISWLGCKPATGSTSLSGTQNSWTA